MQLPLDISSNEFQGLVDSQPEGESIECLPHEYRGPLYFRKEVLIEGHGATFLGFEGPVVIIESSGVTLRDLLIEVTADAPSEGGDKDCALIVESGADVRLENVVVRGAVRGLRTEEGAWGYPHSLDLGVMLPGENYEFVLRIVVPVQCQISSQVAGVDAVPAILSPGQNEVRLRVSSLSKDSVIYGNLCLKTALLKRLIFLRGRVLAAGADPGQATAASGGVVWAPADWDSAGAGGPAAKPGRSKQQVPAPVPEAAAPVREEPAPAAPSSPPVSQGGGQSEPQSSASAWPSGPSSTRIRRQSTPISSLWSPPVQGAESKKDSGAKSVLSGAFQPPPAPATAETPDGSLESATPREATAPISSKVPRARPVNLGIFAQKVAEVQREEPGSPDEGSGQPEGAGLVGGSDRQHGSEETKATESGQKTAPTQGTGRPKAKASKPSVPDVFLKK